MHYWNDKNFEGLKQIGEHYSNIAGYEMYGEYCLLREQGLRKQALAKVNNFIEFLKSNPLEFQRKVTCEIIQRQYEEMGRTHQMVAKPLSNYFETTLKSWTEAEPQNIIPMRWLGFNTSNIEYYKKVFEIDPKDEISAFELCMFALRGVDYSTHHIHESMLLCPLPKVQADLEEAKTYCDILSEKTRIEYAQKSIAYFEELLNAWKDYQGLETDISFPQWCNNNGHKFDFNATYYYDR